MTGPRRDPYAVLGVHHRATHDEIRRAYRALARSLHPDAAGSHDDALRLAEVNAAWRELSDPERRRRWAQARAGATRGAPGGTPPDQGRAVGVPPAARFPWRAMAWLGAAGVVVVLVASVLSGPPQTPPPDQILGAGSCVTIDATGTATEVTCTDPHDAVVADLVPVDGVCPANTETYRDRQGLGLACVTVSEVPPPGPSR